MASDVFKCGKNASEERNRTSTYKRNGRDIDVYTCQVTGTGIVTSTWAGTRDWYDYRITIKEGITGIGDKCYSKTAITNLTLPNTLTSIGNECFRDSYITCLLLPDSLISIGENNFPSTLREINIPPNVKVFSLSNVFNCSDMVNIKVHPDNPSYCSHDGILYTKDMKTLLYCPRSRTGMVIVPEGVTTLGVSCFNGCKKLASIHLPSSLRRIEDRALAGTVHSVLVIPNTVESVGKGAFCEIKVTNGFRFTKQVKDLPDNCFRGALLCDYSFIKNARSIGSNCFAASWNENIAMPEHLLLLGLEELGESAFYGRSEIKEIEFSSRLSKINRAAFNNMYTGLQVRIHSLTPFNPGTDIFDLQSSMKLVVPKGTIDVFRYTPPWLTFPTINEMSIELDSVEGETITDTKLLYQRLESVALSFRKADRLYLSGLLQNLMMNWEELDSDIEYRRAVNLSNYNRMFNPPLVPDLERRMAASWPDRYKYMFLTEIMKHPVAPLTVSSSGNVDTVFLLDRRVAESIPHDETNAESDHKVETAIPLPPACQPETEAHFANLLQILMLELEAASSSVDVAVSWFTNHDLYRLLGKLSEKGIQIRLVINNDSVNNGGYCLDFNRLLQKGIRISLVEYPHMIHHKFCIIDGQTVINGSYNWTRFSEKNYENLTLFRAQPTVVQSFAEEFERLWQTAEHKDIDQMPDSVPARPEYDRQAFRQYVTEELDAQARSISDRRDSITALHRAATLNPEYLDKIDPNARTEYADAFQVANQAETIKTEVVGMVLQTQTPAASPVPTTPPTTTTTSGPATATVAADPQPAQSPSATPTVGQTVKSTQSALPAAMTHPTQAETEKAVQQIMASQLYMTLDISGSMRETYNKGHVKHVARQAVAAALAVSESKEVSLWTFGNDSHFIGKVGIQNLEQIDRISCTGEGTNLIEFVNKALLGMPSGSLIIIFTDDDGTSLEKALPAMKTKSDCFWQIIACKQQCNNIQPLVQEVSNVSLVNCFGYGSKTETELHSMLLHDYVQWKETNNRPKGNIG